MISALRFILVLSVLVSPAHVTIAATPIPAPPAIKSSSYVLMDHLTGNILVENNADQQLEPASLTKIMTAYVVFTELQNNRVTLEDKVLVSEKAWRTGGSRMFIEVNKQVTVNDLLHGMIVQSGNDAAVALAEHLAGSEEQFAVMMNHHAKRLGMNKTHFKNATGWPAEGHVTTARDLAILTRAMIMEFPELYAWHAIKEFTYNNIRQYNRNKLLWRDKTVDGVKTGHTEAAGYCLVASAKRDDMRMIAVIMGSDSENSRASAASRILNYGFRFFESRKLYTAGETLGTTRVWKGEKPQVSLGIENDLLVTIPRGNYKLLKANLEFNNRIVAPVSAGTRLGKVIIELEGKTIATRPLVALEDIREGDMMTRMIDTLRLMIE